jgi:hypothetical protein
LVTLIGSGGSGKSRLALAAEADDAHCVEELAGLNAEGGEPERAARLIGASEALLETAGAPHYAPAQERALPTGTNAVLNIQLNGTNAGEFEDGLDIDAPNSVVKGLEINRFDSFGVRVLDGDSGSTIEGNFIGTNPSGTLDRGNHIGGVSLFFESANNTIGGKTPAARNLISGNDGRGVEIFVSASNEVMCNISPKTKVPVGQTITATSTNGSTEDTSEFSAPRKVVAS